MRLGLIELGIDHAHAEVVVLPDVWVGWVRRWRIAVLGRELYSFEMGMSAGVLPRVRPKALASRDESRRSMPNRSPEICVPDTTFGVRPTTSVSD